MKLISFNNNNNKSDKLTDDEISFFETNWLKKDSNGLYYMTDSKSMPGSVASISFKKMIEMVLVNFLLRLEWHK